MSMVRDLTFCMKCGDSKMRGRMYCVACCEAAAAVTFGGPTSPPVPPAQPKCVDCGTHLPPGRIRCLTCASKMTAKTLGAGPPMGHKAHADCTINPFSSRVCEKGTKCCDIQHDALEYLKASEELKIAATKQPPSEKPQKPIHEMTFADYQRGVDAWWPNRRKS